MSIGRESCKRACRATALHTIDIQRPGPKPTGFQDWRGGNPGRWATGMMYRVTQWQREKDQGRPYESQHIATGRMSRRLALRLWVVFAVLGSLLWCLLVCYLESGRRGSVPMRGEPIILLMFI